MQPERLRSFVNCLIVKPSSTAFWFGLIWALFAMLISRYWVVPNYIPSQDGHILGDPVLYHNLALDQLELIRQEGWRAFELHYKKQGTAGITTMLYWIYPSPILVVLLNALLHGIACAAVTRLLLTWFSPMVALIATLPLALSFVNIFWLAQINKESYVIAGCALFFLGYVQSLQDIYANKIRLSALLIALIGILLIYIPRPHMNQMLMLGFVVTSVCLIVVALLKKQYRPATLLGLQTVAIGIAFAYFSQGGIADTVDDMISKAADPNHQFVQTQKEPTEQSNTAQSPSTTNTSSVMSDAAATEVTKAMAEHIGTDEPLGLICYRKLEPQSWKTIAWLPDALNARIKALADLRCHNHELHDVQDNAMTKQSIADANVSIDGVGDMIAYAPRGLQLGFFGPLPSQWPENSFMKSFFYTVVPIMMVFFYIVMAFAAIWIVRTKAWLALPLFMISVVPLWILGISTSFFGSLFRYRYPIWIILFCFGLAALLAMTFFRPQHQRKNTCGLAHVD